MATINAGRIEYTVGYSIDSSSIRNLQSQLSKISAMTPKDLLKINPTINNQAAMIRLQEIKASARQVEEAIKAAYNPRLNTTNLTRLNRELQQLDISRIYRDLSSVGREGQKAFSSFSASVLTTNTMLKKTPTVLDKIGDTLKRTLTWNLSSSVINQLTGKFQEAYGYVKNLDKSLNDIRIVTGKSAEQMDIFAEKANKAAKALGKSTTDYTNASLIYYQQGLSDEETAARTDVTLKAANVTQQSTAEVSEQLTAVWNGYKVSAAEAELYVDKLAAVAAGTASDLEELSTGMSKVASAANLVGMDVDQMNAALATTISVTKQAPESVGTAYKTILARMTTISAGGTDEDGADLTSYTEKMNTFGINVLDSTGKLRQMGNVIEEVGSKWSSMSREAQISLAQVMAGTRQYNNLTALFDNWDMYEAALETSKNSAGTLQEQQEIYMESTAAHLQQLRTASEGVFDSLLNSDTINSFVDALTKVLSTTEEIIDSVGNLKGVILGLATVALSVFSKQIGNAVFSMVQKVQTARREQQLLAADIANTQRIAQSEGMNDAATSRMVGIVSDLQRYYRIATEEEIARGKELAKNIALQEQEVAFQRENLERAQAYLQTLRQTQAERGRIGNTNLVSQEEISTDAQRQINNLNNRVTTNLRAAQGGFTEGTSEGAIREITSAYTELMEVQQAQQRNQDAINRARQTYNQAIDRERNQIISLKDAYLNYFRAKNQGQTREQNAARLIYTRALQSEIDRVQQLQGLYDTESNEYQAYDSVIQRLQGVLNTDRNSGPVMGQTIDNQFVLNQDGINRAETVLVELEALLARTGEDATNLANVMNGDVSAAIDQAAQEADFASSEFDSLRESLDARSIADNFSALASIGTSIAFTLSTVSTAMEVLGDESLTTLEKIERVIPSFTMLLTQIPMLITSLQKARESWTLIRTAMTTYATGIPFLKIGLQALKTGNEAQAISAMVSAGATNAQAVAMVKLGAVMTTVFPWIIAIAAVIATGVILYNKYKESVEAANKALEEQKKRLEEAQQAYQNIKGEVDSLISAIDELDKKKDALNDLTKGTKEWKDALEEVQKDVEKLLETYPELKKYAKYENGGWTISDEDLKNFQQEKENELKQSQINYLGAEIQTKQAEVTYAKDAALVNAVGRNIDENKQSQYSLQLDNLVANTDIEKLRDTLNKLSLDDKSMVSADFIKKALPSLSEQDYDFLGGEEGYIIDTGEVGYDREHISNSIENIIAIKEKELEYEKIQSENTKQMLDLNYGGQIEDALKPIFGSPEGQDSEEDLNILKNAIIGNAERAYDNTRISVKAGLGEDFYDWSQEDRDQAIELYRKQLEQINGVSVRYDEMSNGYYYQEEGKDEETYVKIQDVKDSIAEMLINQKTLEKINTTSIKNWTDIYNNLGRENGLVAAQMTNLLLKEDGPEELSLSALEDIKRFMEEEPSKVGAVLQGLGLTSHKLAAAIAEAENLQRARRESITSESGREAWDMAMGLAGAEDLSGSELDSLVDKIETIFTFGGGNEGIESFKNALENADDIEVALNYDYQTAIDGLSEELSKRLKELKIDKSTFDNYKESITKTFPDITDEAIIRWLESQKLFEKVNKAKDELFKSLENVTAGTNLDTTQLENIIQLEEAFETLSGLDLDQEWIIENIQLLEDYIDGVEGSADKITKAFDILRNEQYSTIKLFSDYDVIEGKDINEGLIEKLKQAGYNNKEIQTLAKMYGYEVDEKGNIYKSLTIGTKIKQLEDEDFYEKTSATYTQMYKILEKYGLTTEVLKKNGWRLDTSGSSEPVWVNEDKSITIGQTIEYSKYFSQEELDKKQLSIENISSLYENYGITTDQLESLGWKLSSSTPPYWYNEDENITIGQSINFLINSDLSSVSGLWSNKSLSESSFKELVQANLLTEKDIQQFCQALIREGVIPESYAYKTMENGQVTYHLGGFTVEQLINWKTTGEVTDESGKNYALGQPLSKISNKSYTKIERNTEFDLNYDSWEKMISYKEKELSRLEEAAEQLTGDALLRNLEERKKIYEEINKQREDELAQNEIDLARYEKEVAALGAKIDPETGYILNERDILKSGTDALNAKSAEYNKYIKEDGSLDTALMEADGKSQDDIDKINDSYKNLQKSVSDTKEVIENYNKALDKNIELLEDSIEELKLQAELQATEDIVKVTAAYENFTAASEAAAEEATRFQDLLSDDKAVDERIADLTKLGEIQKSELAAYEEQLTSARQAQEELVAGLAEKGIKIELTGNVAKDTKAISDEISSLEESIVNTEDKIKNAVGVEKEKLESTLAQLFEKKSYLEQISEEWERIGGDIDDVNKKIQDMNDALSTSVQEMEELSEWRTGHADKQLEATERQLSRLQSQESRLSGQALINNLNQQKSVVQQQIHLEREKLKVLQAQLKARQAQLKESLRQLAVDAKISVKFEDDGSVNTTSLWNSLNENRENVSDQVREEITSLVDDINGTVSEINSIEDAIFGHEQDILDLQDKMKDAAEQATEKLKEEMSKALEIFNAKVDVEVNIEDAWRQFDRLEKKVDGLRERSTEIFQNALTDYTDAIHYITANPNSYFGDAGGGSVQILTQHVNDIMREINIMQAGGTSSLYGVDQSTAFGDLENYYGQLMSAVEGFYDSIDAAKQKYSEAIDTMISKNSELLNDFEQIKSLQDHGINLTKLLFGEESFEEQSSYLERQSDVISQQLQAAVEQRDYYKQLLDSIDPVEDEENYNKVKSAYLEAIDAVYGYAEEKLEKLNQQIENSIDANRVAMQESLAANAGFGSAAQMNRDWEYKLKVDEDYLDTTNTQYEIESLTNKFNEAISGADSLSAKEKITDVMNEQLDILNEQLEKGQKLTKYDIERANKVYELTLKQIALEEAQENKSKMRLRRDSQGNYRYEYVADQENINNAKQELLDAQNDLYNFDKERAKTMVQELTELTNSYYEAQKAIIDDLTLTEEQKDAELLALQERYWGEGGLITMAKEEYLQASGNAKDLATEELTLFDQTIGETLAGSWQAMVDNIKIQTDELIIKCQEQTKVIEETMQVTTDGAANLESAIIADTIAMEELVAQDEELLEQYDQQIEAIQELMVELQALEAQYKAVMDAAMAAVEQALLLRQTSWETETEADGNTSSSNNVNENSGGIQAGANSGDSKKEPSGITVYKGLKGDYSGIYYFKRSDVQSQGISTTTLKRAAAADGMDFAIVDSVKAPNTFVTEMNGSPVPDKYVRKDYLRLLGFDTGGYTGAWGGEGRMAMLHEKELVLNKVDTANILQAVDIVRTVSSDLAALQAAVSKNMISQLIGNNPSASGTLEQNVKIEAHFPYVSSSSEIEQAFNNLVNLASQRAMRK